MDIDGHPPSPTGPKYVFGNFGNLLFLAVFNFQDHFEALNDVFFEKTGSNMNPRSCFSPKSFISRIDLFNELLSAPNGDRMQKLRPWEVDVSTTPIRACKPFVFSSSGVRFLDFTYVKKAFGASV